MKIKISHFATVPNTSLCTAASAQTAATGYGLVDLTAVSTEGDVTNIQAINARRHELIKGALSTSRFRPNAGQYGRSLTIASLVYGGADRFFSLFSLVGLRGTAPPLDDLISADGSTFGVGIRHSTASDPGPDSARVQAPNRMYRVSG